MKVFVSQCLVKLAQIGVIDATHSFGLVISSLSRIPLRFHLRKLMIFYSPVTQDHMRGLIIVGLSGYCLLAFSCILCGQ